MALKTKITIAGTTIKDDSDVSDPALLFRFDYDENAENAISGIRLIVPRTILDELPTLSVGNEVEMWTGFTTSTEVKRFKGQISNVKPDGGQIILECKNQLWLLIRKNVNKIYDSTGDPQAGVISAIAEDLIETYGGLTAQVEPTGTSDGETISQFKCINTDIYERVWALAQAVDYQIIYDAVLDVVKFEPRGFNDTGVTLTVGTEIIGMPTWEYNTEQMINVLRLEGATTLTDLRFPATAGTYGEIGVTAGFAADGITLPKTPEIVKLTIDANVTPTTLREGGSPDGSTGNFYYVDKENQVVKPVEGSSFTAGHYAFVDYTWAAPTPVVMSNDTSLEQYGEFYKKMSKNDIVSIADAETRALEILARYSTPFITGRLMVKCSSAIEVNIGDLITVVDNMSVPTVNRTLVVTKKVLRYPGDFMELIVGDMPIRLADWQTMTEDRITRLEEELLRNQDLSVSVVQVKNTDSDINNTGKNYSRYLWLKTQDYTVADNTMMWDSELYGIWDTDNWATDANPDGLDDEIFYFKQSFYQGTINKYVETFEDEDFKDSPTTATWGSGTLSFTAGQIATSTAVDYNNGNLTAATITVVVDSISAGSLTVQIQADETNPKVFGTITAPGTYTYTDTIEDEGTALQWILTKSAAGTSVVSKVILEDYH